MPQKKGGKKKKPATKKTEDIKQMPSLVFNNIRMTEELKDEKIETEIEKAETPTNLREKFIAEQSARERKFSVWFWIGAIGLGGLIIFFWTYSLWSNITSLDWKKTTEGQLVKQTVTDWDETFRETKEVEQNQITKNKIKKLLTKLMSVSQSNTSTTSTATTTDSTVTTTISTSTVISNTSTNR